MKLRGKVIKYGEDVNTDVMEGIDPSFLEKVKERKIIVSGKNFGCGSSREQAPVALKYAGLEGVVAESFARIFYRNAVNIGLPVLECVGVAKVVDDRDEVEVDMTEGVIRNITKGKVLHGNPTPEFLMRIMEKGLVQYVKEGRK
jgi:3-isopropylmalate/(R)-2-methylmalate dehydratase small subunit